MFIACNFIAFSTRRCLHTSVAMGSVRGRSVDCILNLHFHTARECVRMQLLSLHNGQPLNHLHCERMPSLCGFKFENELANFVGRCRSVRVSTVDSDRVLRSIQFKLHVFPARIGNADTVIWQVHIRNECRCSSVRLAIKKGDETRSLASKIRLLVSAITMFHGTIRTQHFIRPSYHFLMAFYLVRSCRTVVFGSFFLFVPSHSSEVGFVLSTRIIFLHVYRRFCRSHLTSSYQ